MSSSGVRPTEQTTDVVGDRIVAQIVDFLVLLGQIVVVAILLGLAIRPWVFVGIDGLALVSMLSLPLYGGVLEAAWNGQTVGKRATGIAVVDRDGETPSFSQALVRNIPAVVAFSWLTTVAALASIATSDRNQRVFDDVAETYVVHT